MPRTGKSDTIVTVRLGGVAPWVESAVGSDDRSGRTQRFLAQFFHRPDARTIVPPWPFRKAGGIAMDESIWASNGSPGVQAIRPDARPSLVDEE